MKTKVLSLFLALLLAAVAVSCGSETTVPTPVTTPESTASSGVGTETPNSGETTIGGETLSDTDTPGGSEASTTETTTETPSKDCTVVGRYLGILGYGEIQAAAVKEEGSKLYRFDCGGKEKVFSLRTDENYTLQNLLMEGKNYVLSLEGEEITDLRAENSTEQTEPVFPYVPGKMTLKNLLLTAFAPLGSTLYIYGGGWNWQDDGSSVQATTVGIPGEWKEFFESQTADYLMEDESNPAGSTYPFGGWNEYYYAGLDCSGYLGWVFYNTVNTESAQKGFVGTSSKFAKKLAEEYNFGTFRHEFENGRLDFSLLHPGDVVSISGHCYIFVGSCSDGSAVVLHCCPTVSVSGKRGGGVQLTALSSGDGKDNAAYRLIDSFTKKYFPEWRERYDADVKPLDLYTDINAENANLGVFSFSFDGPFSDPEGYASMTAEEIFADIEKG